MPAADLTGPLLGIVAGAVVAALGYVGKLIIGEWQAWRAGRRERLVRLLQLQALLRASRTAYTYQAQLRNRLDGQLRKHYPDLVQDQPGYERRFTALHNRLDSDESDLHAVIRSYTEHALRPLNDEMLRWLRDDFEYRSTRQRSGAELRLAVRLNQLEAHLLLWLAKYEGWIPNRLDHALVYLADEEKHGAGFPVGIEDALEAVLAERDSVVPPRTNGTTS
jgi:hypothetical protein